MVVGRVVSNPWVRENKSGKVWGCLVGTARYALNPNTQKYTIVRERHTIKCFDPRYIKVIKETIKRGDTIMAEGSLRTEPERVITDKTGATVCENVIILNVHRIHRYTESIDLARPIPNRVRKLASMSAADTEATESSVSSTETDANTESEQESIQELEQESIQELEESTQELEELNEEPSQEPTQESKQESNQ
jgi:hypothetical protein